VIGRLRLWSGLVLFTYLTTHLGNHALGLISLEAMDAGRRVFLALWRHPLATLALYISLLVHVTLALRSLYRRRTLRMPAWEALQLVLGLAIPVSLIWHVVGTRLAFEWFGRVDSYPRVLLGMWSLSPGTGARQTLMLIVAWLHGCIGLHFWLRLRPWYPRAAPLFFAAALLLPTLALLGFAAGGRAVAGHTPDASAVDRVISESGVLSAAQTAALQRVQRGLATAFAAALGLVLVAREARRLYDRRFRAIRLTYPDGRVIIVPVGCSVLEASRGAGIPHASVCGGRGRCSTCRIRVVSGAEALPLPDAAELRVLKRVEAPADVRLACQLRPRHDVGIVPLLSAAIGPRAITAPSQEHGREQDVVVLFADLRGFTRIAEHKLPYDIVFLLNRYFEIVGTAVARAGGIANQFTGDGVMALFGVDSGPRLGARQALSASGALITGVRALSRAFAAELDGPLAIGIGIHAGSAVVGRMGFGEATYLTAVGDTVHVASRLEELTKTYACQLVISEELAALADLDVSTFPRHELTLRNRLQPLAIRVIHDVGRLPPLTSSTDVPA
jgi:adenylate cyclase